MSERPTVHVWGFFDDDGKPRLPSGMAVSNDGPSAVANRVLGNVTHFGAEVVGKTTTRTLDGLCVGAYFVTEPRERVARMWHHIERASDDWPAKPQPDATPDPVGETSESEPEESGA